MAMTLTRTMTLADTHGPVLTGRATAARIADAVKEQVARGADVVLDFEGVQAVSPSFADELFGKLRVGESGRHVHFVNLSEHLGAVSRMAQQRRSAGE